MSTLIILRVLALRHRLLQRDRWTRRQLEDHQGRAQTRNPTTRWFMEGKDV